MYCIVLHCMPVRCIVCLCLSLCCSVRTRLPESPGLSTKEPYFPLQRWKYGSLAEETESPGINLSRQVSSVKEPYFQGSFAKVTSLRSLQGKSLLPTHIPSTSHSRCVANFRALLQSVIVFVANYRALLRSVDAISCLLTRYHVC